MISVGARTSGLRADKKAAAGRLGRRLILSVILISSAVTGFITAFELFRQYRMDVDEISYLFTTIDRSMTPALAEAIWVGDQVQIQTVMNGIVNLRDIEEVTVANEEHKSWHAGKRVSSRTLIHTTTLKRPYKGDEVVAGRMEVVASVDRVYGRIWNTLIVVLASNALKTAIVAAFMLYLFQRLIGRHLDHIADHVSRVEPDEPTPVVLERRAGGHWRPDILDHIVTSMNAATEKLINQHAQLESKVAMLAQSEQEVRRLNDDLQLHAAALEARVIERTAELEAAKDLAEAADRVKSSFLATMSHELRTPLNSIIGFTGTLRQEMAGPINTEQAKQLDMVRGSARHLLALITDVLDISKVEAGELNISRERLDLRAAIDSVAARLKPMADDKGLVFSMQVAPEIGQIVSDKRRLEQVLINLLNNAIKFTDQGEVTLEAACLPNPPSVVIKIRDTGVGIKEEDLVNLFKPFHQVDTGLARKHEGTGLGLAISRRLVELLGGSLQVESQWGKGSVFSVILPQKMENVT